MAETKINWAEVSMGIIVAAGEAKSSAMEALAEAKKNNFKAAESKMKNADKMIAEAAHKHFAIIQQEAKGIALDFKVLFIHAEDQLLTTQTLILLVKELIYMYQKFLSKL